MGTTVGVATLVLAALVPTWRLRLRLRPALRLPPGVARQAGGLALVGLVEVVAGDASNVAVIGLGAAGGLAVLPLARAGLKIVGLEAGGWLQPEDHLPDEIRNNIRHWPHSVQKVNQEIPTARVGRDGPYLPRPAYHPMMNGVGGTSLHYWGQSWRLTQWDFKARSETLRRYGIAELRPGQIVLVRFGPGPKGLMAAEVRPDGGPLGLASH